MPTRMAAFKPKSGGGWEQTAEAKKVLGIIRASGGKPFKVEAAPSPLASLDGSGMWGSGGGVHYRDGSGTYVDPIAGSVSVAAHEAAHASFPTRIIEPNAQNAAYDKLFKYGDKATKENALRAVYETRSKPNLLEEANAQGVAKAAMDKAGYEWDNNGWQGLPMERTGLNDDIRPELAYPGEYRYGGSFDKGAEMYNDIEGIGLGPVLRPYSEGERNVIESTRRSLVPAMNRQFEKGYSLIK